MNLSEAMAWLHYNTTNPNRRTQALIYALKNMKGPELVSFARYATSLSYAFGPTDRELLAKVVRKAKAEKAPAATTGIGQDPFAGMEIPLGDEGGGGTGHGLGLGDEYDGASESYERYNNDDFDEYGDYDGMDGKGAGGGGTAATALTALFRAATTPTTPATTYTYGQRHPTNPNYVWNGQRWIYQPATTYTYGQRHPTNPNYVWNGQSWIYQPTTSLTTPGTVVGQRQGDYIWSGSTWTYSPATTTSALSSALPWVIGGLALYAATRKERR